MIAQSPPRAYRRAYLGWFALAWAGATIAYQPLLAFLLPLRIAAMQGRADPILLSVAVVSGAVVAGVAHLGWGWIGDRRVARGGGRRMLIALGLAGTTASYALIGAADEPASLVAALLMFQVALNLLLSSLVAAAADEVPAEEKGVLGGLLCFAAPAGAAASVAVTSPGLSLEMGLALVAGLATLLILPFLAGGDRPVLRAALASEKLPRQVEVFAVLWIVRLILQVASKALFFFLIYYFAVAAPGMGPSTVAQLTLVAAVVAAPLALLAGRISDRRGAHRIALVVLALLMAAGLAIMAAQTNRTAAVFGYLLFATSAAGCLSLHAGYAMLKLPDGLGTGLGLGILNFSNTLPAVLVATLASALAPEQDYRSFCWTLTGLVLVAAALLAWPPRG